MSPTSSVWVQGLRLIIANAMKEKEQINCRIRYCYCLFDASEQFIASKPDLAPSPVGFGSVRGPFALGLTATTGASLPWLSFVANQLYNLQFGRAKTVGPINDPLKVCFVEFGCFK